MGTLIPSLFEVIKLPFLKLSGSFENRSAAKKLKDLSTSSFEASSLRMSDY